jgi:HEPN superfamily Swt1-like protein
MKHYERIVKAFGMTNMLLEADLDQIEQRFGIDLGRNRKGEQAQHDSHLQFDVSVRTEAAEMASHYEVFYCLEKSMRSLITDVLEAAEGGGWWASSRVPSTIQTEVEKRIKRERESGVTLRSTAPLDYTTFGELSEIIKASWPLFGSVLNDLKAVETVMARLNTLRGPIAHCSALAEDEVLRLKLTLRDWFRLLK